MVGLKNQTCKFTLNIIKDFSPLSRAFQKMLDRVQTPYYIECDEDMVLHHNAVEKMYNDIAGALFDEKVALHAYMLRDSHLDFPIYGVKIYKSEIFKKYPYNLKDPSCEMEQLKRIEADGFSYKLLPDVMGEHSPLWSNELIFERYFNLMEKFKIFRYIWMEKLPGILLQKVQKDPNEQNVYALAGALSSIYSDNMMDAEKDIRRKNKDLGRMLGYLLRPHQCTLYLSSACNFKCSFCYRQHHQIEQAPDMHPDLVDLIMGKFPEINGYCICGFCEPLLSPSLIPVLQRLKAANKVVGIITNGSLLARKLPELCGWYKPDYISVSLNAHTAEEHERITGTQSWEMVKAGIIALVNSPIQAFASSVVTAENINYLPKLIKLVNTFGVKTLHLHNLLPHFDLTKNEDFWKSALTDRHAGQLEVIKTMPEASIVKKWPTLISERGARGACKFPHYSFAVNGNGSMSYCNSVLPCDASFGNIKDYVVWNSKAAQDFRAKFCDKKIVHCSMCFRDWEFDGRSE